MEQGGILGINKSVNMVIPQLYGSYLEFFNALKANKLLQKNKGVKCKLIHLDSRHLQIAFSQTSPEPTSGP